MRPYHSLIGKTYYNIGHNELQVPHELFVNHACGAMRPIHWILIYPERDLPQTRNLAIRIRAVKAAAGSVEERGVMLFRWGGKL